MEKINDGGPAFPQPDLSGYGIGPNERGMVGMTLRDYLATAAMNAFYSSFDCRNADVHPLSIAEDAKVFFMIADAMLKARKVQS